jgi:hypothetical protein
MQPIGAIDLLDVWERGVLLRPFRRAAALVSAACRELSPEQIDALTLGDRDRLLLRVRALTFGSGVKAVASCPACEAWLDVGFDANDVLARIPATAPTTVQRDDYLVQFRLPTCSDIAAIADEATPEEARQEQALLRRCVLEARHDATTITVDALPKPIIDLVAEQLAHADAGVDVDVALTCDACAHCWTAPFDVVAFFWEEIDAWAERTLYDVHRLASAYGWSEPDILALGPRRRQRYLDLIAEQAG